MYRHATIIEFINRHKMKIIRCLENKRPLVDWTPATVAQIQAHNERFAALHPTNRLACIDIDIGPPWAIINFFETNGIPYVLEKTPRPGWHIWHFTDRPIGNKKFAAFGMTGELRTSDCYTCFYEDQKIERLFDTNRDGVPLSLYHRLLHTWQPLYIDYPDHQPAKPKRRTKKQKALRRAQDQHPIDPQAYRRRGRNNRLSAGLYFSLKTGASPDRHLRKALMDGLPHLQTYRTLDKKRTQRARDITRRDHTLRRILIEKPLPRYNSQCLIQKVLRAIIDLGLHSGLSCAKRQTIASMVGCCVRTITRHTNTLMALGYLAQIGKLQASVDKRSGWQHRTNIWAIFLHTANCQTKALMHLRVWVWRPSTTLLPAFALSFLRSLPPI